MEVLFGLGIVFVTSYFLGLFAERMNFPRVTAYLLSGVLFSENLLGSLLNIHFNSWFEILVNISLGLIAFVVGAKLKSKDLSKEGREVVIITLFESLMPVLFVYLLFFIFGSIINLPNYVAIILAAVSATTDPAASLAVIEQYNAKGKLKEIVLGVAALDDAFGVIVFALITGLFLQGADFKLFPLFLNISLSVIIGGIFGFFLSKAAHLSKTDGYLLPLLIGFILITEGLGHKLGFSFLITCIVLGFVSSNTHKKTAQISLLLPMKHIEELVFIIFFSMAGMKFSIFHFKSAWPFILIYFFARFSGKYLGAFIGARLSGNLQGIIPNVVGLALLPQAGIAIGIIFQISHDPNFENISLLLLNTILGSTILFEVIGTFAAKYAFIKTGDIENHAKRIKI